MSMPSLAAFLITSAAILEVMERMSCTVAAAAAAEHDFPADC
jgi:hypothetical protein